jgi:hypothetical protein
MEPDKEELICALREARVGLHEALADLTDYFTIKHVKGYLDTVEDVLDRLPK